MRIPPGNARWIALSAGVLVLSVVVSLISSMFGWIPARTAQSAQSAQSAPVRQVQARVVTGRPCSPPGGLERVKFTVDGREHQVGLDACGHQADEPIEIRVPDGTDLAVLAAQAATGQGRYGRRLGQLLLVLAGLAGALYAVMLRRGPRGTPLPVLGPFDGAGLLRRTATRPRRGAGP